MLPHKAPHSLVAMLAALRGSYGSSATLTIVGNERSEGYSVALRGYVHDLGLDEAVTITGAVSEAELEAYWHGADVFVCASEPRRYQTPLAMLVSSSRRSDLLP